MAKILLCSLAIFIMILFGIIIVGNYLRRKSMDEYRARMKERLEREFKGYEEEILRKSISISKKKEEYEKSKKDLYSSDAYKLGGPVDSSGLPDVPKRTEES